LDWILFGKKTDEQSNKTFFIVNRSVVERTKEHLLEDIIFITIAAVICGCENWNEIESYRESKQQCLSGFLRLPGGIPYMIPSIGYLLP
jgi:hypothetical protein